MKTISYERARNIVETGGLYLLVRKVEDIIAFVCDLKANHIDIFNYNAINFLLHGKEALGLFEEIDLDDKFELVGTYKVEYYIEFNFVDIISQLPVTIQDRIDAIEMLDDKQVNIYRKKNYVISNGISDDKLFELAMRKIILLKTANMTYRLRNNYNFDMFENMPVEDLFKENGESIYIPEKIYNFPTDKLLCDVEKETSTLKSLLSQIPKEKLTSPEKIVIIPPSEYVNLNVSKYSKEYEDGFLVYEYIMRV